MRKKLSIQLLVYVIIFLLGGISLASCSRPVRTTGPLTYYVSASGNDAASGISPNTAWRSLSRADSAVLRPGDRLLLQGGHQFAGDVTLDARDAGNASQPVLISSYGTGRATIATSNASGIVIYDTAGVQITNLSVAGTSVSPHSGAGINVYSDLGGNRKLDYMYINNVSVTGFANGIAVGGGKGATGFRNVWIGNSILYDNLDAGLQTYGPPFTKVPVYANDDVNISHVTAFHNHGDPRIHAYSTGSGIILASVQGGSISWSTSHDNGGAGIAAEGPEGIWAYNSTDIIIAHDVSYNNHTSNRIDGNGFGLDQNTSNSYLEYDLSYGNDGAGYMLFSRFNNRLQSHNVVRFNISYGNSQDGSRRFGGINIVGVVSNTAVYQNTVVTKSGPYGSPALILGSEIHRITIRNNIFVTRAAPIVAATATLDGSSALLQGNDYYTSSSNWLVVWGQNDYSSLDTWRSATGQETLARSSAGFTANPEFTGRLFSFSGKSVGKADSMAFMLRRSSPLIGKGLNLHLLSGLESTMLDYSGVLVSARSPNVGAE
jgi:hypothetical protein